MADEKIDPAKAQLARESEREIFPLRIGDKLYGVQLSSTCEDGVPALFPISEDATARLRASAAAQFAQLADSTYCRKEKIGFLMNLYGRGRSTIEGWLSLFNAST